MQARIGTATQSDKAKAKKHEQGISAARKLLNLWHGDDPAVLYALAKEDWSESKAKRKSQRFKDADPRYRFMELHERVTAAWQLVQLGFEMRTLWAELAVSATNPDVWDFNAYAAAQKRIALSTRNWLATGQKFLFGGTDGIDRQMAAFFIALGNMAGLSNGDVRRTITLSIQHTTEVDKLIVVR